MQDKMKEKALTHIRDASNEVSLHKEATCKLIFYHSLCSLDE